jgi:hypothetical protein
MNQWQTLIGNFQTDTNVFMVCHTNLSASPQQFYRIKGRVAPPGSSFAASTERATEQSQS